MSIIYKALQKTQKTREKSQSPRHPTKQHHGPDWILRGLIVAIAVLSMTVVVAYYPRVKQNLISMAEAKAHTEQMQSEETFKQKHTLNGIFLSDNNKVAMINSQYYHVGDVIDGLLVYHICDRDVRLRNEHQNVTLETPV